MATVALLAEAPAEATAVEYGGSAVVLVGLLFVLLGLLFVLMLFYTNRIESTHYVGKVLDEALGLVHLQKRLADVQERWERRGFHQDAVANNEWFGAHRPKAPPAEIANHWRVEEALGEIQRGGRPDLSSSGIGGLGGSDPTNTASEERERIWAYIRDLRNWERDTLEPEARRLRSEAEQKAAKEAAAAAALALGSIDLASLRGRGPEFILRFTAVVVIIFATIALSLLDRLGSEQAGTILAAIAGYVLGQAATSTSRAKTGDASAEKRPALVPRQPDALEPK